MAAFALNTTACQFSTGNIGRCLLQSFLKRALLGITTLLWFHRLLLTRFRRKSKPTRTLLSTFGSQDHKWMWNIRFEYLRNIYVFAVVTCIYKAVWSINTNQLRMSGEGGEEVQVVLTPRELEVVSQASIRQLHAVEVSEACNPQKHCPFVASWKTHCSFKGLRKCRIQR